jgi:hypothetical protein
MYSCVGKKRHEYRVFMGRPEGKKPLGKPRHKWENKSKMDLQEVGWGGMDCIISLRIGTGGRRL